MGVIAFPVSFGQRYRSAICPSMLPDWQLPVRIAPHDQEVLALGAQVALSLLVMAPSIVLVGSQMHKFPAPADAGILLVSLVAQCVESQAALWLLLKPTLIWAIFRLRGMRTAAPASNEPAQHTHMALFFLSVGPTVSALLPAVVWGVGRREPAAVCLSVALLFLIVPLLLLAAIWRLSRAPRRPAVTAAVLIALTFPCAFALAPAYDAGRKSLERSIGTCRIAGECVRILKDRIAAAKYGWCAVDSVGWPALSRIAPARIDVRNDKLLKVELGGGFDHYGYRLSQDEAGSRWVLEWYTEGFSPDERLLSWPIGSDPCDHHPPSGS